MSTKGGQKSGADKSSAPTNAWARPLQSKGGKPAPPPGMGPPSKPMVSPAIGALHRERLLHLSLALVGRKVILHQTDGAIVEGIFHTFTPFESLPADQINRYVLKEIIIQQQPSSEPALKDGVTLVIPANKVVFLHAADIASDLKETNNMNGGAFAEGTAKGGFATDTQISGGTGGRANDLVAAGNAWTSGGTTNYRNQGVEPSRGGRPATNSRAAALSGNKGAGAATAADLTSGSIGKWDQFQANKELFNVNATFDESLYTTELDKSQIDAKKMKEAERIAKEIQNTTTDNIHMAEERGFKVETDFDEEDLYSGVLTKDGKQRHEKVTITKKSDKESKPSKSAPPKKIMNYAAAAAKADTTKGKSAPPGFTPAATTKDEDEKEKTNESSSAVVTPEKNAKADAAEKSEPSKADAKNDGEKSEKTKKPEKEETSTKDKEAPKEKPSTTKESSSDKRDKKTETKDKATEKKEEKNEAKKSSKLNANAKSFTFNPSAKSFTPTFGASASSNPPQQQQPPSDPNMQMYGGGHPMQPPHYMQGGPMGQPGMMPMMNPQYPGMRYPSAYGMEQPMSQMQHQAPHTQATPSVPSAPSSGNAPTPTPGSGPSTTASSDDEGRQQGGDDSSQTQAPAGGQQPQRSQEQQAGQPGHSQGQPQQQMPMPYNVPPNAYFSAGMAMPPRGPGYPQFVGGPQQIAGRPGVPPYGIYPMQPGGMPQNMQMRGPNGAPYYPGPNGPMPYPPNAHMYPMMDDGGRGRGGRNSNGGRGGRGRGGRSGRGGRGRSNYNNNGSGGKNYHQSQQQAPASQQQGGQSGNNSSSKSD